MNLDEVNAIKRLLATKELGLTVIRYNAEINIKEKIFSTSFRCSI